MVSMNMIFLSYSFFLECSAVFVAGNHKTKEG